MALAVLAAARMSEDQWEFVLGEPARQFIDEPLALARLGRRGTPGNCEQRLIFYVDKREHMIVFMDVVAGRCRGEYRLRFYGNECHQSRSVLVRREACDADLTLPLHDAFRAAEADL
jgi:hypothetical protein